MNYILSAKHGKKIAVILNGTCKLKSQYQSDFDTNGFFIPEFGDCKFEIRSFGFEYN